MGSSPLGGSHSLKLQAVLKTRAGHRLIPSEGDMYQMHAYATAYNCTDLALIYPWRAELGGSQETRFGLHGAHGSPASVRVICISLESDHFPAMRGANGGRIGPLLRSA